MSNITENTRRFIENSDIDYFTYFIKSWIPFNAWYKNKWADLNSDREAINFIKNSVNETRSAIINHLENNSDDAKSFKSYFSSLHFQLMNNNIENNGVRISFLDVKIGKNRNRRIDETFNRLNYQLERVDNRTGVEKVIINVIKTDGTNACGQIEQDDYNLESLKDDREFKKLTVAQQNCLMNYYKELIPYQSINLIESHPIDDNQDRPDNYTPVGSFSFIENNEKIAQGLIEVMYALRCVLFHGELNPNEANNEVYKNLYHILFMILQKLR